MMKCWKLFGVAVLAASVASVVLAQGRAPQGPPPGGAGPRGGPGGPPKFDAKKMEAGMKRMVHDSMKPALKLTDAQEKKVVAVYVKSNKTMMAIFKDKKATWDQKRKKLQGLRTSNDKAINAILTPSQRKLFKEYKAKHPRFGGPGGRRPGGMGRPGGPPPGGSGAAKPRKAK